MPRGTKEAVPAILNGGETFPQVELRDATTLMAQRDNVAKFKRRWRNAILSFAVVFVGTPAIGILSDRLLHDMGPGIRAFAALPAFVFIGVAIYFASKYKCPSCGTRPAGTSWSASGQGVVYTKGLHPFPARCRKCGSYLSSWALDAALKTVARTRLERNTTAQDGDA